jgi:hypothetical protein
MPDDETKIKIIEDRDATGEVAQVYDEWRAKPGRQQMPGILKFFSHRPDSLRQVMQFSDTVHFSEGHLNRGSNKCVAVPALVRACRGHQQCTSLVWNSVPSIICYQAISAGWGSGSRSIGRPLAPKIR